MSNGIIFSPDEKILYVSDVDTQRTAWLAYDAQQDRTVTNGCVFFDTTRWRKDPFYGSNGFKVDQNGNLFETRMGGVGAQRSLIAAGVVMVGFCLAMPKILSTHRDSAIARLYLERPPVLEPVRKEILLQTPCTGCGVPASGSWMGAQAHALIALTHIASFSHLVLDSTACGLLVGCSKR